MKLLTRLLDIQQTAHTCRYYACKQIHVCIYVSDWISHVQYTLTILLPRCLLKEHTIFTLNGIYTNVRCINLRDISVLHDVVYMRVSNSLVVEYYTLRSSDAHV